MGTVNAPMISLNRGIISKLAQARIDVDRVRMSADVMTNWLPKTQGPMILRPGTKYIGSSYNDSGAAWIEFVAATDSTALLELTSEKMRVWIDDTLLSRPKIDTGEISLDDTGWFDSGCIGGGDTGGSVATTTDLIPVMTAETTENVKITASSSVGLGTGQGRPWKAADNTLSTYWRDTGNGSTVPSWINVDFSADFVSPGPADTGTATTKTVGSYFIRAGNQASMLTNAPKRFSFIGSDYDTGTYATDTGKWTEYDRQTGQTGWAVSEKRSYTTTTPAAKRHWRLNVIAVDGGQHCIVSEIGMFPASGGDTGQVIFSSAGLQLLPNARESIAKAEKRVATHDTGTEHSLDINVTRGPVILRVGSTRGADDLISETTLRTGYHNLAFTPSASFYYVTVQATGTAERTVSKLSIGDSGTVEIITPWSVDDVDRVRTDQSADVIFADHPSYQPRRIERRGTGRSWSVVEYAPDRGPFIAGRTSSAKLTIANHYGNTQLTSDIPFFDEGHVGALFRITHNGQSGNYFLGAKEATTDVITMTGLHDTGTPTNQTERRALFTVTGKYSGRVMIERSFVDEFFGFRQVSGDHVGSGSASDTGTFTCRIDDHDDNITVYYRARLIQHDDTGGTGYGVARVAVTYDDGQKTGICRVTDYVDSKTVDVEVIDQFSQIVTDTGVGPTENWEEGAWSGVRGFPGGIAFHDGRLVHAGKANLWASVSDDFENFDDTVDGDAAPLNKTLGSGPVDDIYYLISLLRLAVGTTGGELSVKSSSLDEPITASNSSIKTFSTHGSANIRAERIDNEAFFVQRSQQRLYRIGFGSDVATVSDYTSKDMTALVPDLLEAGISSIAVQREPDTRLHCVLNDGRVAIMTYEPEEEVLAWSIWQTDTGTAGAVEKAMVLPGVNEDRVYYHVRRTINGSTKRYLEKWALESECRGDTGLSWLVDCAAFATNDTGRDGLTSSVGGFSHLAGERVVVWANDTGQSNSYGKDLSVDIYQTGTLQDESGNDILDESGNTQEGVGSFHQTEYYVNTASDTGDTGKIGLAEDVHHVVAGLPYQAEFKSTKLAYGAQFGTALAQVKRVDRLGLLLYQTHNNGVYFGYDSGHLDPMPRVNDNGAQVDADKIFEIHDKLSIGFPGTYDADSRIHLRAKAPRPATVMALVPTVNTNEKM